MSANYPDHVSHRDFNDPPVATCPVCKDADTYNFTGDSDGERSYQSPAACDDCAAQCHGCNDTNVVKVRHGVCQGCIDNAAEFDIAHLLRCEVELKRARWQANHEIQVLTSKLTAMQLRAELAEAALRGLLQTEDWELMTGEVLGQDAIPEAYAAAHAALKETTR